MDERAVQGRGTFRGLEHLPGRGWRIARKLGLAHIRMRSTNGGDTPFRCLGESHEEWVVLFVFYIITLWGACGPPSVPTGRRGW